MRLIWDINAWEDYLWWQAQDRKVLKRINMLIRDVMRNGNEGIGSPSPSSTTLPAIGRDESRTSTDSSTRSSTTKFVSRRADTTTGVEHPRRFAAEGTTDSWLPDGYLRPRSRGDQRPALVSSSLAPGVHHWTRKRPPWAGSTGGAPCGHLHCLRSASAR